MCRCAVRHATDVPKDGMTTSGYGAENTRKIRGVDYSPVGNGVTASYADNASLAYGVSIALLDKSSQSYEASLAIWDHTVLPSTRHK